MMQTTLGLGMRNVFEANDLKPKFPNNYMGDLFPHFCQAQPSSGESNPWIFLNVVEGRNQCLPVLCNFCLKLDKYGSHPCKHVHHCTSRCLENWFLATEFCVLVALRHTVVQVKRCQNRTDYCYHLLLYGPKLEVFCTLYSSCSVAIWFRRNFRSWSGGTCRLKGLFKVYLCKGNIFFEDRLSTVPQFDVIPIACQ